MHGERVLGPPAPFPSAPPFTTLPPAPPSSRSLNPSIDRSQGRRGPHQLSGAALPAWRSNQVRGAGALGGGGRVAGQAGRVHVGERAAPQRPPAPPPKLTGPCLLPCLCSRTWAPPTSWLPAAQPDVCWTSRPARRCVCVGGGVLPPKRSSKRTRVPCASAAFPGRPAPLPRLPTPPQPPHPQHTPTGDAHAQHLLAPGPGQRRARRGGALFRLPAPPRRTLCVGAGAHPGPRALGCEPG